MSCFVLKTLKRCRQRAERNRAYSAPSGSGGWRQKSRGKVIERGNSKTKRREIVIERGNSKTRE